MKTRHACRRKSAKVPPLARAGLTFLVLAMTLSFGEAQEPVKNASAPPAWYTQHIERMTSDGGRWIANNNAYQSDDETWDAYGVEWRAGPDNASMSGRLFGLKEGTEGQPDFWVFSEFWDPQRQRIVVQQYGWGSVGVGRVWRIDDTLFTQQTFSDFDGNSREEGHQITFRDDDTHETHSYGIGAGGLWTARRHYVWKRER